MKRSILSVLLVTIQAGKMGYALAEEFAGRGAEVVLVSGPVSFGCEASVHSPDQRRISCPNVYPGDGKCRLL